jgi:hypothetical protein
MKAKITPQKVVGKLQNLNYPVAKQVGIQGPEGPEGPIGPKGDDGINWLGDYSAITTYNTDDAVQFGGSSYIAIQDNFSDIAPTNVLYWNLLASAGDDAVSENTISAIAGENISIYRVVYIENDKVYLADKNTLTSRHKILGITIETQSINNLIDIKIAGSVTNASWNWNPGNVYVGSNGALTQVEPTSGYIVQIGIALNQTTVLIDIDKADYLEDNDLINGGTF